MSKTAFDHPIFQKASTYHEVGDFLGTDYRFVEREAQAGRLRVHRFNSRVVRILPWHLIEYLQAQGSAEPRKRRKPKKATSPNALNP